MLVRITSSYFCAGVVLNDKVVIRQAKILGYMHGWTLERVLKYCKRKGWRIETKP